MILYQVMKTPPPRVSEQVDIPEKLDELIHHCLAKDPAGRPQSATEIIGTGTIIDSLKRKLEKDLIHKMEA